MSVAQIAQQQIVAATAATLAFQGVDSDGEPSDPGTVTVSVATSDGTAILTDESTTEVGTTRAVTLTAAQTATVDRLTAVWEASGTVIGTTYHDVAGGVLISSAEFKRREPKRSSEATDDILAARFEVDALIRRATGRSFVPRFDVETTHGHRGQCDLVLDHPDLREMLWATDSSGNSIDVSSVPSNTAGIASGSWPCGDVTVGYVHGMSSPPDDVVGAAATLMAAYLIDGRSAIPSRADSFQTDLGTASFIPRAGYGRAVTAIDKVDEVLNAYRWNVPGIA